MPVRPLDLLDLITLYNFRHRLVPLDSARTLTRGNRMSMISMLSYLNPRREIATAISTHKDDILLGQVTHSNGSPYASLAFLAPEESSPQVQNSLLDHLSVQAGEWGCLAILAEVDESSPVFRALRHSGFSMVAWQRIWKMNEAQAPAQEVPWNGPQDSDLIAIQGLHNQIVPAILQVIEPMPRHASGLVCRQDGEIQATVNLAYGPAGIWAQPLIHPEAPCLAEWLTGMLASIPNRRNRPVYVCVRSYQAWLESMLEELGASAGERQAVMVRHLSVRKFAEEALPTKPVESAWAKPATPVARIHPGDAE